MPPHCPNCNTQFRLPMSGLKDTTALSVILRRSARGGRWGTREDLNRLALGRSACPSCGETVAASHDRRCFREALSGLGFTPVERERLVARMTFPE